MALQLGPISRQASLGGDRKRRVKRGMDGPASSKKRDAGTGVPASCDNNDVLREETSSSAILGGGSQLYNEALAHAGTLQGVACSTYQFYKKENIFL